MKYYFCRTGMLAVVSMGTLVACTGVGGTAYHQTPTVDYIESLNVSEATHGNSFLNQLAMNYRSYAIYNARTSGHPEIAELFANKAVSAFSGESPFPESVENWNISDSVAKEDLQNGYESLFAVLDQNAENIDSRSAAEAQAKFDCWLSAVATGQTETAKQCRTRFVEAVNILKDCRSSSVVSAKNKNSIARTAIIKKDKVTQSYYPATSSLVSAHNNVRDTEGIVIVNNVVIPERVIVAQPESKTAVIEETTSVEANEPVSESNIPNIGSETVDRAEFINMIMAIRTQLQEVNSKLDTLHEDRARVVIQREPVQKDESMMQEVLEIPCNSDSKTIEAEYNGVVQELAQLAQDNENVKIYTDDESKEVLENYGIPVEERGTDISTAVEQAGADASLEEIEHIIERTDKSNKKISVIDVYEPEQVESDYVNRQEFIDMMAVMQKQLEAINERLSNLSVETSSENVEKTLIKVQQLPSEPSQHIVEEVFEIHFDFDKAIIKPEYNSIIDELATMTQNNKNIKVSVVGHTDTSGSKAYNYALGGRRAEAVQNMLVKRGIPASQIVAVSAGEEDLKVKTPDGVKKAENRRVRVVKETTYTDNVEAQPLEIEIEG